MAYRPMGEKELARWQASLARGWPLGDDEWVRRTAGKIGLEHTLRGEGRPKRKEP